MDNSGDMRLSSAEVADLGRNDAGVQQFRAGHAVDEAVDEIGVGSFTWLVLFVYGFSNTTQALEFSIATFLSVCAAGDLGLQTNADLYSFQTQLFTYNSIANCFGAGLSGPAADTYGRWPVFVVSTAGAVTFGLLSATSTTAAELLLWRAVCNFFGGAQGSAWEVSDAPAGVQCAA